MTAVERLRHCRLIENEAAYVKHNNEKLEYVVSWIVDVMVLVRPMYGFGYILVDEHYFVW